jgi:2',3'-cyclic-nucleotide 2'-phosphodiesterase (5'-nucleotidase family)
MPFTLQLLHASDQEAGIPALQDADRFSAVLNALRNEDVGQDGNLTLSSGDAYIPGAFLNASAAVTNLVEGYALGAVGRADILIQNELGFQAIAFGNHEFDLGTTVVKNLITASGDYPGTNYPYLSTNLDFSTDTNFNGLIATNGNAPQGNSVTGSVVIDVNGTPFGVIGATTPTLGVISSPGTVGISPAPFNSNNPDDVAALAAEIQSEVDALTAAGVDHIILLAHMQQLNIERQLAGLLENVDIIAAGGSNTLLADETDILRAGDTAGGAYPILEEGADGNPVAVVNTDGNYKYVGRLVVTFDDNGVIDPTSVDSAISGAYATDDAGVTRLNAEGLVDPEIDAITDALEVVIAAQDGEIFGRTNVFLNGTRNDVRTQETNLGNLTADANLYIAKQVDPTVVVSLKNGGGIRDNIGFVTYPPGSTAPDDLLKLPPAANPLAGKEEGDISQLDVANSLRFNNSLALVTVSAEELKQILEHGVADTAPGQTPGRFPQVGGLSFSFDATQQAQVVDPNGVVTTPGERIRSLAIVDERGRVIDVIVDDGEVVGNPNRKIRMVTLGFLATNSDANNPGLGGDGYPLPAFGEDVVDLLVPGTQTGNATLADDGSEQDALQEYLLANFDANNPFDEDDTAPSDDTRIQNLDARRDGVFDRSFFLTGTARRDQLAGRDFNDRLVGLDGNDDLFGNDGRDRLQGGNGKDLLVGGKDADTLTGNAGRDIFVLQKNGDRDIITDFDRQDKIGLLGSLSFEDLTLRQRRNDVLVELGNRDLALLKGVDVDDLNRRDFRSVDL